MRSTLACFCGVFFRGSVFEYCLDMKTTKTKIVELLVRRLTLGGSLSSSSENRISPECESAKDEGLLTTFLRLILKDTMVEG